MGAGDDDLNSKLLAAAQKRVGSLAVTKTHFGKDCFVLVDMLLREIGAATAADGSVKVTPHRRLPLGRRHHDRPHRARRRPAIQ